MQIYERGYKFPVFHLEDISLSQQGTMVQVFEVMESCGIDFIFSVISEDNSRKLEVYGVGDFTNDELKKVLEEITEMYKDGQRFDSIKLYCDLLRKQNEA